jgi:hypothetical protein
MNHARMNYAQIFVCVQSVCRMRNSLVERTWTVCDCKWLWVEGGLCMILSFKWFTIFSTHCVSLCIIHESVSVVYASSMPDYARDTCRPSVLMHQNWFETAHVHPLMPHVHITHEPCTYHVHSTDMRRTKVLVCGTFAKRACLDALHQ